MDATDLGDLFERAIEIVSDALELPPDARQAYLHERCAGDQPLLETALRLLEKASSPFLEEPIYRRGAIRPGDILGSRFHILEKIGEGGMGVVFRARDAALKDIVAVKAIRPESASQSSRDRFGSEVRLARSIGHPNICPIYDYFSFSEEDGREGGFYTMKYLEGETLAERIAKGPLPLDRVLDIAWGIAQGLDAAHATFVIHRDLKPRNIILTRERDRVEQPVIMDFGIAKTIETPTFSGATGRTEILGSPEYMAPEQFLGERLGPAVDIYALAIIVFEMTSGTRPFPEENVLSAAVRRATGSPLRLTNAAPNAPRRWDEILGRALASSPDARPKSAGELVRELEMGRQAPRFPFTLPTISRRSFLSSGALAAGLSLSFAFLRLRDWGPVHGEQPTLMLTEFTHDSAPKSATVTHALELLLRTQFQQSAHVQVLSEAAKSRILDRMTAPTRTPDIGDQAIAREVAWRAGAPWVLFGNVSRLGEDYTLHTELDLVGSDPGGIRQKWANNYDFRDADIDSASSMVQRIAHTIRRQLGESQGQWQVHSQTPQELTTSNWRALQLYAQASRLKLQSDRPQAIGLLHEAVGLDNKFAAAYGRLGDYLTSLNQADAGLNAHAEAANLVREKNLTDRESLQIRGMFALDTGQYRMADETYKEWRELYSGDTLPYFYGSMASKRLGHNDLSDALLHDAIARSPESYVYAMELAYRALEAGNLDLTERLARSAAKLEKSGWTERLLSAIAFGRADFAGVWAALERMSGFEGHQVAALQMKACFRAEQTRLDEAEQIIYQANKLLNSETDAAEDSAQGRLMLIEIHLLQDRPKEVFEGCARMLAESPGKLTRMRTGCLLARAGYVFDARKCLVPCPPWPIYQHWRSLLEGELALARGDVAGAQHITQSTPEEITPYVWPELRFRASLRANDRVESAELTKQFARSPGLYWSSCIYAGPGALRPVMELCKRENKSCSSLANMFV